MEAGRCTLFSSDFAASAARTRSVASFWNEWISVSLIGDERPTTGMPENRQNGDQSLPSALRPSSLSVVVSLLISSLAKSFVAFWTRVENHQSCSFVR